MKKIIITFIILIQLTGCTHTIKTVTDYKTEEYYGILGDDSLPQLLTDKNVTFSCKEMIYSSVGHTKKCYVKKDEVPKINYWAKRILITTGTAVAETIGNIVIVAFYGILGAAQSNGR